jgi:hypothetical protein
MADKAKKVAVTALKAHTHDGKAYDAGDTYQVDEALVESLAAQGMAKPSDEVAADAHAAKDAAKADAKAAKQAGAHPVAPMTTENAGLATPKPKK